MTADRGDGIIENGCMEAGAISSCSDERLVLLCREGGFSVPYFSELVYRYFPLIKSKAGALCGAQSAYDDFIQEGMLGLISAVKEFSSDKGAKFSSYAYSCVVNRMKTAAAKLSRQQAGENEDDEEPKSGLTPESIIIQRELFRELENTLSPMEHEIFLLHMAGFGTDEIGQRLGIGAKAADNALQRTRRKLREKLAENGI